MTKHNLNTNRKRKKLKDTVYRTSNQQCITCLCKRLCTREQKQIKGSWFNEANFHPPLPQLIIFTKRHPLFQELWIGFGTILSFPVFVDLLQESLHICIASMSSESVAGLHLQYLHIKGSFMQSKTPEFQSLNGRPISLCLEKPGC